MTRLTEASNNNYAFGRRPVDGIIELPGAMSRKKQVAPGLLAAAGSA